MVEQNWHKKERCSRRKEITYVDGTHLVMGNLLSALKRVKRNKGSHGVDGMSVQNLRAHKLKRWDTMKNELLEGTYKPQPVRRIEITQPDVGIWLLGILTATDCLIQQAIAQVFNYHIRSYVFKS